MAKIELSPLIKSMSGTIARRRLSDGTTVAYVVTKKNRLYVHTSGPRTQPLSPGEMARRIRFGVVASAVASVSGRLGLPSDPVTRKQLWKELGDLYDVLKKNTSSITSKKLVSAYCVLVG